MKKIYLILCVIAISTFVSCTNNKQSEEVKKAKQDSIEQAIKIATAEAQAKTDSIKKDSVTKATLKQDSIKKIKIIKKIVKK